MQGDAALFPAAPQVVVFDRVVTLEDSFRLRPAFDHGVCHLTQRLFAVEYQDALNFDIRRDGVRHLRGELTDTAGTEAAVIKVEHQPVAVAPLGITLIRDVIGGVDTG